MYCVLLLWICLQLHRKAPLQGQQEQDRWIRNRVGMCSKRRAMIDVNANATGHAWMHMCLLSLGQI